MDHIEIPTNPTAPVRTFGSLGNHDTFKWNPDDSGRCTKVIYGDGTVYYRAAYHNHSVTAETNALPVYDVETEAQASARYEAQRKREAEAKRSAHEAFRAKMADVAKVLGFKLEAARQDWLDFFADLTNGNERIVIRGGTWSKGGRLIAFGSLPDHSASQKITLSDAKTAQQTARDIAARVLPGYRVDLDKALKAKAQELAHLAKQAAGQERIAKLIKGNIGRNGYVAFVGGSAQAFSDGDVSLSLRLSLAQAEKVLALVRTFKLS